MQVLRTTVYKTTDNRTFEDKGQAKRHESELTAMRELRQTLAAAIGNYVSKGPDAVLKQMLDEADLVAAILRNYIRQIPKTEVATTPVLAKAA